MPTELKQRPAVSPSSLLLAVIGTVGMATIGVISRITQLNAENITFIG